MDFIIKHWTIIVGVAATVAYISEKVISYFKENKKKKEAYNRFFVGIIKFYYSYLKHKNLYQELPIFGIPDEQYIEITKLVDSFNKDIANFERLLNLETEVIPEISLRTHTFFDIIERLRIIDNIPFDNYIGGEKLITKRAQFYALEEFIDDFFEEIINTIHKKTTVKKSFVNHLFYLNTEEYKEKLMDNRKEIMIRYCESLNRQGVMPDEVFNELKQTL